MADVSSLHVQALVTEVQPQVSSLHVQAMFGDGPFTGPPPAWLPIYVMTVHGWLPTFPRWLFDNHPPRG